MDEFFAKYGYSEKEWQACLKVLGLLKDQPFLNPDNERLGSLITKVRNAAKKQLKKAASSKRKTADLQLIADTTIAKNALENTSQFSPRPNQPPPSFSTLEKAQNCYSCNARFSQLHSFYHRLCPTCAKLNYHYRFAKVDLSGRKVVLTGGRVKIGYATALRLLRSEAQVTITTRFPALALEQFQREEDYDKWKNNLAIYGLDLRNLKAVYAFIEAYQEKHAALDILINNAAQTIKYDSPYYQPLIARELELSKALNGAKDLYLNPTPVLHEVQTLELATAPRPTNRFSQPVDPRSKNSWNARLSEVDLPEVLEVNLINHIAPYLLIQGFTPLLKASPHPERFIINVTSSEGQFSYSNKTIFHPHTNMTKAALNMLTKTSAPEYAADHIYMNSVDVGWVSTGVSEALRKKQFAQGIIPPLDPVDGGSRILHPILETIEKKTKFVGQLLKNYRITDW